jgi:hypothetical protein
MATTVLIGTTDQTAYLKQGSLSLKLNTFDFALENPAVVPASGDVVVVTSPAWTGNVAKITRRSGKNVPGYVLVTISATNQTPAVASQAPFNLSDSPTGGNMLTANQAGVETDATGWRVENNATLAQTAAQAHSGTKSLQMTSAASGNMNAGTVGTGNVRGTVPVLQGAVYSASAWFRAAVSPRVVHVIIEWIQADGTTASAIRAADTGTGPTDSTTGWTQSVMNNVIPPTDAAFAQVRGQIVSTGAASEVHYVDDAMLTMSADATSFIAGGTAPSKTWKANSWAR